MGFIQQHLGKMILAGVAVVFIVLASLNYSGMCISESRYLTDREKYEAVLIKTIHRIEPGDGNISAPEYSNNPEERKKQLQDKADAFLEANPSCCRIITDVSKLGGEGWFDRSFFGRLSGAESYVIEIRYQGKRQNSVLYEESGPRVIRRTIGTCGKIYSYI